MYSEEGTFLNDLQIDISIMLIRLQLLLKALSWKFYTSTDKQWIRRSTLSSLIVFIDVVDTYIVHITLGIYYYTYVRVRKQ